MIRIAHRGNIAGADASRENHPTYIDQALVAGFDAEIDLNLVEGQLMLGHDRPDYQIDANWLFSRSNRLWVHCKDFAALSWCSTTRLNYFWHENDRYTLTSLGYGWVYPGNPVYNRSIMVMPDTVDYSAHCHGICLDKFV